LRREVRDDAQTGRVVRYPDDSRLPNGRVLVEAPLDFSQFDPVPSALDHSITTAKIDIPV
jgi:hypothetical protein